MEASDKESIFIFRKHLTKMKKSVCFSNLLKQDFTTDISSDIPTIFRGEYFNKTPLNNFFIPVPFVRIKSTNS